MGIQEFALNLIQNNPNIRNNPQAQQMIDVIRRGDSQKGEQIARNLCQTFGMKPEDAYSQAQRFFGGAR